MSNLQKVGEKAEQIIAENLSQPKEKKKSRLPKIELPKIKVSPTPPPPSPKMDFKPIIKAISGVGKGINLKPIISAINKVEDAVDDVDLDLSPVVEAIEGIDNSVDLSPVVDALTDLKKSLPEDKSDKVIKKLEELIKKIPKRDIRIGGGGSRFVNLTDTTGAKINPATKEKQDEAIDELQDIETAIGNLPQAGDSATLSTNNPTGDAFGRLRVSEPVTLFDSKQINDNQPLFWDDQQVSGNDTNSTYNQNKAATTISVDDLTAGKRVRQTFMRFNYQPGKSQLVLMTFKVGTTSSGNKKQIGMFDDDNGIFLEKTSSSVSINRRTKVSGSVVDNTVAQANWNLDPMDGTGPSGITIDTTKTQILVIDFEWLGVGRVRCGFNVDGVTYYFHEFLNANNLTTVYMSTPNLPLRYSIENDGTGSASTMDCICSSVMSEGGLQQLGTLHSDGTKGAFVNANTAGTYYALIGIRLQSTKLGANILLEKMLSVLDTADIAHWELRLNPTVAGTFTYSDVTNSAVQTAIGNTASNPSPNTVTGGTVIDSGYISSQSREANIPLNNALRLGAAIDGTRDEIVLCATPSSTDSNLDIAGGITWRELS